MSRGYGEEAMMQRAVFEWINHIGIYEYPELQFAYHTPNEGKRSVRLGLEMIRQGLKSGVPDICIPCPRGKYHGAYIELKTAKGKTTESQLFFLKGLQKQGYYCVICRDIDVCISIIQKYMSNTL